MISDELIEFLNENFKEYLIEIKVAEDLLKHSIDEATQAIVSKGNQLSSSKEYNEAIRYINKAIELESFKKELVFLKLDGGALLSESNITLEINHEDKLQQKNFEASSASDVPAELLSKEFINNKLGNTEKLKSKETKQKIPDEFRDTCIDRVGDYLHKTFIKDSRVIYTVSDMTVKVVCLIAMELSGSGRHPYFWFGFRPKQKEALEKAKKAYLILGCGSPEFILLIPYDHIRNWLTDMSTSGKGGVTHWNVIVVKEPGNLRLKTMQHNIALTKYILPS